MNWFVVFDTDFLSSFLKIDRLQLVREFYQVETATIAPAVYYEIAPTTLTPKLAGMAWIQIQAPQSAAIERLRSYSEYNLLGPGEQESIALALPVQSAILLGSDNRARRFAQSVGVRAVNIFTFLLACKTAKIVTTAELASVVQDLAMLDFYRFRQDELERLLK